MTMRVLLIALLLAACSPPVPPPPAAPQDPPPAQPIPAVSTLAGEWRVASIDGKDFNEPYGLALTADAEEIWWAPRCAGLIRTYRISGTMFRTGPAKGVKPRKPGEPTPPVCLIGLPARIDEVTRALDSATTIRRTPGNGIEISGGGHSLLLFSQ
jgi:hypothetical protein